MDDSQRAVFRDIVQAPYTEWPAYDSTPLATLIKQFVSEKSTDSATDETDETDGSSGGQAADDPSLTEIKAAAKEGTAEALAASREAEPNTTVETSSDDGTASQSNGGSSLKRLLLLGVVGVYVLRRRRSKQSADAQ